MLFITALFLFALQAVPACARIYPLKPYSATVYEQSRLATIKWQDDGQAPHLEDIGPVNIELWTAGDGRVATLAKGTVASAKQVKVHLPRHLPKDVQDYYLRFVSHEPEYQAVYTAHFIIEKDKIQHDNDNDVKSGSPQSSHHSSTVDPYPISYLLATPTASANSSQSTTASPTFRSENDTPSDPAINSSVNFGLGRFSGLNVEKLKFRLVFILWPSLIGLCMAL